MVSLPKLSCFRVADSRHEIFSSEGAERFGGRWNYVGSKVIYAASSLALAILELRVHLNQLPIPATHKYIEITATKSITIEQVTQSEVKYEDLSSCQEYGYKWLQEKRSLILFVPSVIVPIEMNILINPTHPEFKLLKACEPKAIELDRRLF